MRACEHPGPNTVLTKEHDPNLFLSYFFFFSPVSCHFQTTTWKKKRLRCTSYTRHNAVLRVLSCMIRQKRSSYVTVVYMFFQETEPRVAGKRLCRKGRDAAAGGVRKGAWVDGRCV